MDYVYYHGHNYWHCSCTFSFMLNISVTYNDESQIKDLSEYPNIHLIDSRTKKGRKEAWTLKSHWSARLDPFVIIMKGDKAEKAFYAEAGDSISNLIQYLNEKR